MSYVLALASMMLYILILQVLPLLKPAKKLFAEVVSCYVPKEGDTPNIHVCSSSDETTHFDSVEAEVLQLYEGITGERLESD